MVTVSRRQMERFDWEPIHISASDFNASTYEDAALDAGEVGEVLEAEIGEDNQFASYDVVQLGDSLDGGNQDSAKGKLFVDLRDDSDGKIDERTEVRIVTRPKNQNRRTALTNWYALRDLDQTDPDLRIPLPPVTFDGRPAVVKEGRILAVEIRNSATSITVDQTNSDLSIPAQGGY